MQTYDLDLSETGPMSAFWRLPAGPVQLLFCPARPLMTAGCFPPPSSLSIAPMLCFSCGPLMQCSMP